MAVFNRTPSRMGIIASVFARRLSRSGTFCAAAGGASRNRRAQASSGSGAAVRSFVTEFLPEIGGSFARRGDRPAAGPVYPHQAGVPPGGRWLLFGAPGGPFLPLTESGGPLEPPFSPVAEGRAHNC